MTIDAERFASYPLSSQQCAVHVDDWQERARVHAILIEGPAGEGHVDVLRAALNRAIERHEILRTCYRPVTGLRYPVQCVRPVSASAWHALDPVADDELLIQTACSLVNLQEGPLVGAAVAVTPAGKLRWALAVPAYSLDASTLQELAAGCVQACAVGQERSGVPEDVVQYPDYVAWQGELRASEFGQEGVHFWEHVAVTSSKPSRLPFETRYPADGVRCAETVALTSQAEKAVTTLAERLSMPAETVVLALWAGFVARILRINRLSFHWHDDMRAEELKGALGCFGMRLPVSLDIAGDVSVGAMLRSVAAQMQTALSWRDCFDAAVYADHLAKLDVAGAGIGFAYVRVRPLPSGWAFRRIELDPVDARLQCLCLNEGGKHVLRWHGTAVYLRGTLHAWMRQFVVLLESAGRDADVPWMSLPMLGRLEREQILLATRAGRSKPANSSVRTLHELFETQVDRVPESLAVVCGSRRLTYRELDQRADVVASRLRNQSVGAEQRIGIYLGRSVDVIAAMLAVLKSGAAYVPLDPAYPVQRVDDMVSDADISVVIGTERDRERFEGRGLRYLSVDEQEVTASESSLAEATVPHHLAYVIYTSGSTGRPKGVMVSHANAVSSTLARFTFYRSPVERFLLLSSPSFDSSVAGIYWTLSQGGTLYIPSEGMHHDSEHIAKLISDERISHLLALPSFYKQILEHLERPFELKCAVVAGEACHPDVVELHRRKSPTAILVNEYGPTEGTVWSNAFRIDADETDGLRIPIGRPIDSMYGYVLDERLELCPLGVLGEWYVGGDGVARGYVRQPSLTAHRFVADPSGSGERLYRTGDRVRLRPDGEVEYLGRTDSQIKLRGYRIELEEIEAALRSHEGVSEAAALVHDDQSGQRLAGFFVMTGETSGAGREAVREELSAHLRRVLPSFMVPAHLVPVASLPLMPNGKVDRRALVALLDQGLKAPYVPPTDEVEHALAQIWKTVLNVERIGIKDNFFDLGGHSLLATQVMSRIRQMLAVDLPLKYLFETTTLSELAERIRTLIDASRNDLAAMETVMADEGE